MATITFSLSSTCAGTNHYDVTVHLGAQSTTFSVSHKNDFEPMTGAEKKQFAKDLVRFLVGELVDRGVTNVRTKLAAASLTLEI
jgi:hypothetical protein